MASRTAASKLRIRVPRVHRQVGYPPPPTSVPHAPPSWPCPDQRLPTKRSPVSEYDGLWVPQASSWERMSEPVCENRSMDGSGPRPSDAPKDRAGDAAPSACARRACSSWRRRRGAASCRRRSRTAPRGTGMLEPRHEGRLSIWRERRVEACNGRAVRSPPPASRGRWASRK